jgi:hypothetical protein
MSSRLVMWLWATNWAAERKKAEADSGTVEENPERKKVFVYVCGEVQASGVYELEQDSRVFEAIAKAGGLTENAAAEAGTFSIWFTYKRRVLGFTEHSSFFTK